jgi:hypothetical protein
VHVTVTVTVLLVLLSILFSLYSLVYYCTVERIQYRLATG